MKKAIAILLLIPALCAGQGLKVTKVKPAALCAGDSLHITVKFVPGITTQITLQGVSAHMGWTFDSSTIVQKFSRTFDGHDTVYTLATVTNPNLGKGFFYLYANATPDHAIVIDAWCPAVGLKEINQAEVPVRYFDLFGNATDPEAGKLLIEQRGNVRRKVIIQ